MTASPSILDGRRAGHDVPEIRFRPLTPVAGGFVHDEADLDGSYFRLRFVTDDADAEEVALALEEDNDDPVEWNLRGLVAGGTGPDRALVVAEDEDGRPCGFFAWGREWKVAPRPGGPWLDYVLAPEIAWLAPACRGRGLTALMVGAASSSFERDVLAVTLRMAAAGGLSAGRVSFSLRADIRSDAGFAFAERLLEAMEEAVVSRLGPEGFAPSADGRPVTADF